MIAGVKLFIRIVMLLLVIQAGSHFTLYGQDIKRYNSFSYNVNDGLLQSTIFDIAFDKNNFCWLSFSNGIQTFDGKNFTLVPVQAGLPDDKFVYFLRCKNGDLLLSHAQGISKYDIARNRFTLIHTFRSSHKRTAQLFGEDENIVYFFSEPDHITGLNLVTYKIVSEKKIEIDDFPSSSDYRPKIGDNIINHTIAFLIRSRLYLWNLKVGKLISKSDSIPSISPYMLTLKTADEALYNSSKINNALLGYNFINHTSRPLHIRGKDDTQISRCIIYPWQNHTLISFSNKVYIVDSLLQSITCELVNFQNKSLSGTATISRIEEDNAGNLFLCTVTNGIRKIIRSSYPIKYYGTGIKDANFVISILPDKKNNRILAGTVENGLLIFDTLQRLVKHISKLPGEKKSFSPSTIIKSNEGNYLLFNSGEKKVWQLSNDFTQILKLSYSTNLPDNKSGINYFGNLLFQNEQVGVVQSQGIIFKKYFVINKITEHEITNSYTMSGMFYNSTIVTHTNDELIFFDTAQFNETKRISFKNTGGVRCFAKDAANNIYMGSNKGIFKIDSSGKILWQLNKTSGLPDECIYAMVFDDVGFLWCSTNKGIFRVNRDNSILQLKKEDGLQENEFNTNIVAKSADGEIFFGGVNGVSSFYPDLINNQNEKINLLVTDIKINNQPFLKDSAAWNIDKINLPFNQNSISFDFIAMATHNPDQYLYQYKMEGIDKDWLQNNGLQTVRYFLPPGNYIFKIYASRLFDKDAQPMKQIRITIHPPFWKTWWFITGMALVLIVILAYLINQYLRGGYQKKLALLEGEHKLRIERERISRDLHDSIGAYANAVLYNTELLEKETTLRDELMTDLKFASKDIITSLRETIWALKKDNYSAEDCLLRIRNFIQPFSRYYKHIQFKVEGNAPAEKILHYTHALSLVRIVQEAITNAIKHADATNIRLVSNASKEQWEIIITDDGKGFGDYPAQQNGQGNGLNNIKQRGIDAGFQVIIHSTPGAGTSITIHIF